jgi:hypothetical protein
MSIKNWALKAAAFGLALGLASGGASAMTPADYMSWFKANQNAKATFKAGDVITFKDAEKIRAFIPPGYQEEMLFEGMQVSIHETSDLSPPLPYQVATKKFQGQVTLAADGALENYTAGQPFAYDTLTPGKESGFKAAWNFNFRWQSEGLEVPYVHWVWVRKGGNHDNHSIMNTKYAKYYTGGGSFERVLAGPYLRVYFTHRSDLPDQDYKIEGSWAKGTEFRELTGFTEPFDIDGTAFLILRHDDPHKADDSWAYIPSLRRVRRISVEVKSDSLLGTDHTLEDFYCFAGRILEHDWNYIGVARILAVARSRNDSTIYYGPNGWTPLDNFELRSVDVYQQIPKSDSHPYSVKFIHTDRNSGECYYANGFDQAGELWKVWQLSKVFTEDPWYDNWVGVPKGIRGSSFQSINVIDKQNGRGTLVPCYGNGYPQNKMNRVKRKLDVNQLTEGR